MDYANSLDRGSLLLKITRRCQVEKIEDALIFLGCKGPASDNSPPSLVNLAARCQKSRRL
jgi:hypothetical protein